MFTPKTYKYNCTRQCNSLEHGQLITRALTKRSPKVTNEKLAAFIAKTCQNFMNVLNEEGKSAVHMAASVGCYKILEWLLNQEDVIIDGHDLVTGSTPLHCAIFYGYLDCAILLMRYGAPLDRLDNDTCLPLQRLYNPEFSYVEEIYAWGRNTNHNLALTINGSTAKTAHSMRSYFRKNFNLISDIAIGTYHTLFLLKYGFGLYSVGHGKGGRLGHGGEHSLSVPKEVKKIDGIIAISVSKYHSLIASRTAVFSCGLNKYYALGLPDNEGYEVLKFTRVMANFDYVPITDIIACDQYSVVNCSYCIYFWGTNNGQIPLKAKNEIVKIPYMYTMRNDCKIKLLSASNKAVAVWTDLNVILLYYNYLTQRVKLPYSDSNITSLLINDGDNLMEHLQLLILDEKFGVYIWSHKEKIYYRCSFTPFILKPCKISKILWTNNELYLVHDMELYRGIYNLSDITSLNVNSYTKDEEKVLSRNDLPSSTLLNINTTVVNDSLSCELWQEVKSSTKLIISRDKIVSVKIQHIPYFNQIIDIFSDVDCESFIIKEKVSVQNINNTYITNKFFKSIYLFVEEFHENALNFTQNFSDGDYNFDKDFPLKCDCILHIDNELYPAHKMIIIDRAPGLQNLFRNSERHIYLDHITNLNGKTLKLLLQIIYLDKWPSRREINIAYDNKENIRFSKKVFLGLVMEFGILKSQKNVVHSLYNYEDYVHLSDICIKCSDGPPIYTHKCMLMAHSEYFYTMINNQWVKDIIEIQTVPYYYMYFIVRCFYNNHKDSNEKRFLSIYEFCKNELKMNISWYQIIIYCDQLLLDDLSVFCQINLARQINIENCLKILKFADTFNCHIITEYCNNFIVGNFSRFIYKTSIEHWNYFDKNCLMGLRNTYFKLCSNNILKYRQISTHPKAIDDKDLLQFVEDFQLDTNDFDTSDKNIDDEALLQLVKDIKIDLFDSWISTPKKSSNEDIDCNSKSLKSPEQDREERSVRKFELEAISVMKENLNNNDKDENEYRSEILTSFSKIKEDIDMSFEKNANWIKLEKRKMKKPYLVEQAEQLTTSSTLSFTNLNKLLNSTLNTECKENDTSSTNSINDDTPKRNRTIDIDLCSLLPQHSKMTQKERKRLLSTKKRSKSLSFSNSIDVTKVVNPWNISNTTNPFNESLNSNKSDNKIHNTKMDPNSFANIILNERTSYVPEVSPPELTNCKGQKLKKLLDLNKSHQNNIKNKPLHLIQLEEKAISELKIFYNAENATDEVIVVERLTQLQ